MPLIICGGSRPLPSRPLSVAQGLSTAHRRAATRDGFLGGRARLVEDPGIRSKEGKREAGLCTPETAIFLKGPPEFRPAA